MPVEIAKTVSDGFLEQAMIMDKNYIIVDILDTFESFYWIERYNKTGDFEIIIPIIEEHLPYIRIGNYISIRESETYMIIENVTLKTDVENGDTLIISGRTLESMLDRRIVWGKLELSAPIQNIISIMIQQNASVSTSDSRRRLPLIFQPSSDPRVLAPVEQMTLFGDNVYDQVSGLCEAHNIGIKSIPSANGLFVVTLYSGVDRSWSQNANPPVVFSDSYENLLESNYVQTEVGYASNSYVRGDADDVTMEVLRKPERTGLNRREIFIDANIQPGEQEIKEFVLDEDGNKIIEEVQKTDEEGNPLYDDAGEPVMMKQYKTETKTIKIYDQAYYNSMLAKARIEMAKHSITEAFDSSVDTTRQFFYGEDYNLGDIVQVENRYGFSGRCRITEVMRSRDASGPKLVPTFVVVDENGNEVTT